MSYLHDLHLQTLLSMIFKGKFETIMKNFDYRENLCQGLLDQLIQKNIDFLG